MRTPCNLCAHLNEPLGNRPTCKAFPGGIPLPIFYGQRDHDKPVDGDRGIVFEHKHEEYKELATQLEALKD